MPYISDSFTVNNAADVFKQITLPKNSRVSRLVYFINFTSSALTILLYVGHFSSHPSGYKPLLDYFKQEHVTSVGLYSSNVVRLCNNELIADGKLTYYCYNGSGGVQTLNYTIWFEVE